MTSTLIEYGIEWDGRCSDKALRFPFDLDERVLVAQVNRNVQQNPAKRARSSSGTYKKKIYLPPKS